MEIKLLSQFKEYESQVISWLWKEWGNEKNYKRYEMIIQHSQDPDNLPQTFVALEEGKVVGTVGLWRCDLMSRQDLFPWLASLYVDPAYRSQGIGKKLQNFIINYCKDQNYDKVYLYTDLVDYYETTGWELMDCGWTEDMEKVNIYQYNLE